MEMPDSEEEKEDILEAYRRHKGSMDGILSEVPLSSVDDENRFIETIQAAVRAGVVESSKAFALQTTNKARQARRKAAEQEAREAEQLVVQLGLDKKLADENGDSNQRAMVRTRCGH